MNSTRWRSLTEFIMDLAREGSVKAEDTEKGWFISYIDRSPGAVLSEEQRRANRDRLELDDAERDRQRSFAQLRAAKQKAAQNNAGGEEEDVHATALARDEDQHVEFTIAVQEEQKQETDEPKKRPLDFDDEDDEDQKLMPPPTSVPQGGTKKLSKLEEIALRAKEKQEQSSKRAKTDQPAAAAVLSPDAWLVKGLIVKGL